MCNSRGVNDSTDESAQKKATIDLSKYDFKCTSPKLGRKGDPRMQKAMEARLENPSLSLLDSLEIGGFKFRREGDVWYDTDNIQLSQRKNQLSRRLRLFRKSRKKTTEDDCKKPRSSFKKHSTRKTGNVKDVSLGPKPKKENESFHSSAAKTSPDKEDEEMVITKSPAQSTEMLSVPSWETDRELLLKTEMEPMPIHMPNYTQSSSNSSSQSLNSNATSASLTATSSPSTSTSSSSMCSLNPLPTALSSNTIQDPRLREALNLYSSQSSALMKACMISAGYSSNEVEEGQETYLTFFESALERETVRLAAEKSASSLSRSAKIHPEESLPSTNSGAVYSATDQNSGTNEIIQQPLMSQGLATHTISDDIRTSSFANAAGDGWNSRSNYPPHTNAEEFFPMVMDPTAHFRFGNSENGNGPQVLDLKDVNIDGEEWNAVLRSVQYS